MSEDELLSKAAVHDEPELLRDLADEWAEEDEAIRDEMRALGLLGEDV